MTSYFPITALRYRRSLAATLCRPNTARYCLDCLLGAKTRRVLRTRGAGDMLQYISLSCWRWYHSPVLSLWKSKKINSRKKLPMPSYLPFIRNFNSEKALKSIDVWRSYGNVGYFLWLTVYIPSWQFCAITVHCVHHAVLAIRGVARNFIWGEV